MCPPRGIATLVFTTNIAPQNPALLLTATSTVGIYSGLDIVNVDFLKQVTSDDGTVPEPQHFEMQCGNWQLVTLYSPHTPAVSQTRMNIFSYGILLQGGRSLLYELGAHKTSSAPHEKPCRFEIDIGDLSNHGSR